MAGNGFSSCQRGSCRDREGNSSLIPLWGGKCVTWRITHVLLHKGKKTSQDWRELHGWENQQLYTNSRKDLFLGDSQVRLLLWLLVEIMLLYLLLKHLGLVTWCNLVFNSTVLHLIIIFYGSVWEWCIWWLEKKKSEAQNVNRCVKKTKAWEGLYWA